MLKIGTSGSRLALWQAEFTQSELARIGVAGELVIIDSRYDFSSDLYLDEPDGKDVKFREIEAALLSGDIDVGVHSMDDMPTETPEGLAITAVAFRDNPADLLLIHPEAFDVAQIFKLKSGAVVSATSACRKVQMQDIRPDTDIRPFSGNAPALLENLREGLFDALILTAAEVYRLELDTIGLEVLELNPREFVPAPAQGVFAWLTNRDDLLTRRSFKKIHHPEVSACTNVERRLLQLLGGRMPLGVYCERDADGNFHAFAACLLDGEMRRAHVSRSTNSGLAEALYDRLLGCWAVGLLGGAVGLLGC
jgi:hydroxymethylbilane synthase